jgi:hypothetical protein
MCPFSLGREIEPQLVIDPGVAHAVELPFGCIDLERQLAFLVLYAEGKLTIA